MWRSMCWACRGRSDVFSRHATIVSWVGLLARTCARRRTDFLCFAKESRQRKASRRQGRCAVPCAARLRWGLAELALRAQTTPALIPLPLRCSALPQRRKPQYPRFKGHRQLAISLAVRASGRKSECRKPRNKPGPDGPENTTGNACVHLGRTLPGFPAVMRRRVAQRRADQGWRCPSAASSARPRPARATQCAHRAAKGRRIRLAFLLLTFLWRSKEK